MSDHPDFFVPLLALCTRREAVQTGHVSSHIFPTVIDARILNWHELVALWI